MEFRAAGQRASALGIGGRRFRDDVAGGLTVTFGILGMILAVSLGAAIDTSRWLHARTDTLLALEAAILAGGKSLQMGDPDETAVAVAAERYRENSKGRLDLESDTIAFSVVEGGGGLTAGGAAYIGTPLMSILGIQRLPLVELHGREFATAMLAIGDNAHASIELALVLDMSEAMRGDALADVKAAARNLVDIVVWDDQSRHTSRVALVPFAADVRLPADLLAAVRDPAAPLTIAGQTYPCATMTGATCFDFYSRRSCVVERTGPEAWSDAGPGPGRYVPQLYAALPRNCTAPAASTLMPLTSSRAVLAARIDGLAHGLGRAAQVGAAWGWYVLSPEWTAVLPGDGEPAAYGSPDVRKIAVLLLAGQPSVAYSEHGVAAGVPGAPLPTVAANGPPAEQVLRMCEGMKASGIEIYAVGFGPEGGLAAADLVAGCASSAGHAQFARSGPQLKSVFRDIGTEIATLYMAY